MNTQLKQFYVIMIIVINSFMVFKSAIGMIPNTFDPNIQSTYESTFIFPAIERLFSPDLFNHDQAYKIINQTLRVNIFAIICITE